jgi:hypothetical protein
MLHVQPAASKRLGCRFRRRVLTVSDLKQYVGMTWLVEVAPAHQILTAEIPSNVLDCAAQCETELTAKTGQMRECWKGDLANVASDGLGRNRPSMIDPETLRRMPARDSGEHFWCRNAPELTSRRGSARSAASASTASLWHAD